MKKIILLVITAISLIGCNLNKENNDWKRDNLKGKVKSVRETPYYVVEKFGEIQKGRIKSFITSYIYNEQGNRIEANRYNSDGNLYEKWTYKYDTNGNLIEGNEYNSDGSLYATDIYTYEYDKYGNWVKRIMYNNDKPESIDEREIEYYE